jgi:endonuclease/exonuclease/phosphatase family metal-dependent hydrolase
MNLKVGTFNLNNLFSRFNFQGAIDEIEQADGAAGSLTIRYEFTDPDTYRIRTFLGRLVKAKDPDDTAAIARRIISMNVDVLAVQEVENVELLRKFNRENLGGLYRHEVLIEGNDARFIDVGLLSKLPVGAVTSHQTAPDPDRPGRPVFGRDLLEAQILSASGSRLLFTLFNNHLKSHFVPFYQDPIRGAIEADALRRRQAQAISRIVGSRMRRDARYVIVGDMNDPPDSPDLRPMLTIDGRSLVDGLKNPAETRPSKRERVGPGPRTTAWTYRFKESGKPPTHRLLDHMWLSAALENRQVSATIDRRTTHGGDGSDHDPAWIELEF